MQQFIITNPTDHVKGTTNQHNSINPNTVKSLSIGTNRSEQTVQTRIRLLQMEQSDQDLHCLPIHLFLFDDCYAVKPNCLIFMKILMAITVF